MIDKYLNTKIGKLTCLEFIEIKKKVNYYFKFKCDCGNFCIKNIRDLIRKDKKISSDCGCVRKAKHTNWSGKVGEKINNLSLIEFLGKQSGNPLFKYKCHCGNIKTSSYQNILRTSSCGCQISEVKLGLIFQNFKVLEIERKKAKVQCTKCNKIKKLVFNVLLSKKTDNCVCDTGYNIKDAENKKELNIYRRFINSVKYRRNQECDIQFKDWLKIVKKNCEYCDRTPKDLNKLTHGLDRINSNLGYLLDNVCSCCYDCNVMKSDLKIIDFYSHIRRIYNHITKVHKK